MKVIILHIDERTVNLSREIAAKQGDVHLLSVRPREKAITESYRLAIKNKWEWMILMCGDQFLSDNAIQRLKEEAIKADENVFRISGLGYDNLLMRTRMMSPSIYRVSLLEKALEISVEKKAQPESWILRAMERKGYPFIAIKDSLCTHDMEQYYRDIYRKGFFEASKFLNYILDENIIDDLEQSGNDDHKIFLLGINDFINKIQRTPEEAMKLLNLTEKKPL